VLPLRLLGACSLRHFVKDAALWSAFQLRLLSSILALLARQQTFVLYPQSSELTTKQAAEVLGVSRPFLIRVLEAGEIPYRKVGRHRRVLMKDVLAYKQSMQVKRRAALDELAEPDSLEPVSPKNRHVATAIATHADAIVTSNLADFAAAHLKEHLQIEVIHPDDFVMDLVSS
jgi:excisionase family DNA binding protein